MTDGASARPGSPRPPGPAPADVVLDPAPLGWVAMPALLLYVGWLFFCIRSEWGWMPVVVGTLGYFALASALQRQFVLVLSDGVLEERTRLLGRTVRVRRTPFGEFDAVVFREDSGGEGEAPGWQVGLRRRDGRRLWLCRFVGRGAGGPNRPAGEFAWRVSCDTGIPTGG